MAMQRSMESLSTWDCNQGSLNTIVLIVRIQGRRVSRRGSDQERSSGRRIKVMSGVPTAIYDVHHARKTGWPIRGDPQGHGIPRVVGERESRLQGEGEQGGQWSCLTGEEKRDAAVCSLTTETTGQPQASWRAGCAERCMSGSERGVWKRAAR